MAELQVSGWSCVVLALLLRLLPPQWVGAALGAAVLHECCHAGMVTLLGGKVYRVAIGGRGAVMEAAPMSPGQELLAVAAGPAGSLLLVALGRWLPRLALCGLIQGCFNLLPIYPLDGGRMLRCILEYLLPNGAAVSRWVSLAAGGLVGGLLLRWGVYPGAFLVFAMALQNIPCKDGKLRVQ